MATPCDTPFDTPHERNCEESVEVLLIGDDYALVRSQEVITTGERRDVHASLLPVCPSVPPPVLDHAQ